MQRMTASLKSGWNNEHDHRTILVMTIGYSGKPLVQKLGYKDGMRVWFDSMPGTPSLLAPEELEALRKVLDPAGFIWVSWPKKAAKVTTDITEDTIRAIILPNSDLVDVKVCAVDAVWSGLKLMIRKDRR